MRYNGNIYPETGYQCTPEGLRQLHLERLKYLELVTRSAAARHFQAANHLIALIRDEMDASLNAIQSNITAHRERNALIRAVIHAEDYSSLSIFKGFVIDNPSNRIGSYAETVTTAMRWFHPQVAPHHLAAGFLALAANWDGILTVAQSVDFQDNLLLGNELVSATKGDENKINLIGEFVGDRFSPQEDPAALGFVTGGAITFLDSHRYELGIPGVRQAA